MHLLSLVLNENLKNVTPELTRYHKISFMSPIFHMQLNAPVSRTQPLLESVKTRINVMSLFKVTEF